MCFMAKQSLLLLSVLFHTLHVCFSRPSWLFLCSARLFFVHFMFDFHTLHVCFSCSSCLFFKRQLTEFEHTDAISEVLKLCTLQLKQPLYFTKWYAANIILIILTFYKVLIFRDGAGLCLFVLIIGSKVYNIYVAKLTCIKRTRTIAMLISELWPALPHASV